ncbi:hypothetical protein [Leisingera sp. S232]|uniref:hypothetical protein n=1 Tax=Leisingera sp. S232 TaxID=3415132 RepID=UPI003C7A736E
MTSFEIASSVCVLLITAAILLYLRHLVRTSGSDPIDDPERVKRFLETAPYHLLEKSSAGTRQL